MKKILFFLFVFIIYSASHSIGFAADEFYSDTAYEESGGSQEGQSLADDLSQSLITDQVVKKSYKVMYYAGDDGTTDVHMEIFDGHGGKRIRDLTMLRKDKEDLGEQKIYAYFHNPADVRDMIYMVWKHYDKEDDRWLYLPALDLVRRISASDKRSSFAGAHFVYEDVSGRSLEDDTHEIIEETPNYYILKNVPKNAKNVEFSFYYIWISKENFIPVKGEYYDKEGQVYRIIEALEVQIIQGFPQITKMKATDVSSGGYTLVSYDNLKFNIGLTDDIFTERYLRQAPVKWIKGR